MNMDANKSFICEDCKKSFTLKWNLKAHAVNCKGFEKKEMITCEKCEGRFSSKRTLKVHILTCFQGKMYHCKDCSEKFVVYKQLHEHRQKFHTSSKCDYCDVVVANSKNMKRHILTKHKGLTHSKARKLEIGGNSKRSDVKKKTVLNMHFLATSVRNCFKL
jgi:DNA-directed RNA polymerase subunit RPC12/RpoP